MGLVVVAVDCFGGRISILIHTFSINNVSCTVMPRVFSMMEIMAGYFNSTVIFIIKQWSSQLYVSICPFFYLYKLYVLRPYTVQIVISLQISSVNLFRE